MHPVKCKLTALVLCKNAAETLASCLSSLQFCDAILVADDASTDNSVQIAREYHATVFNLSVSQSFSDKRNEAMQQVQEGWVLFVDADEVVDQKLSPIILKAMESGADCAYALERRDVFLGKVLHHGEVGSVWITRLMSVGSGTWIRVVHERFRTKKPIIRLRGGVILHTPHPTLDSFLNKINSYTDQEILEHRSSYSVTLIQLFVYPVGKFLQNFVLRLGFLDGWQGLMLAYFMSLHSLLVRIKRLEYLRSL